MGNTDAKMPVTMPAADVRAYFRQRGSDEKKDIAHLEFNFSLLLHVALPRPLEDSDSRGHYVVKCSRQIFFFFVIVVHQDDSLGNS